MKNKMLSLVVLVLGASLAPAQDEPRDLAGELRRNWEEIESLARQREQTSTEDERDVLNVRIGRRERELRADFRALMSRIEEAETAGGDASADRGLAGELLAQASPLIRAEIEHRREVVASRHASREQTPPEERLDFEQQLTRDQQDLDQSIATFADIIEAKATLSLDAAEDEAYLDRVLEERADDLTARTELALRRRDEVSARIERATGEEKARAESELPAVRERLHGNVASLEAMVALMDARSLDATLPKELLIQATGSVTTDIFDARVLSGLVQSAWENASEWLVSSGPQLLLNLLLFFLIVAGFWLVSGLARKFTKRAFERTGVKTPVLLKNMIVSLSGKLILLVGVIVALPQIGINIGPLLAGVGVAGFIVGFALQDTLSNFASGVMILLYQPFDVGDVVEAGGVAGKVSHMSVVSTTVQTFDNQILIVPNTKIWGDVIRNKTAVSTRRVDLTFGIGYGDDIARAESVLRDIVGSHELVLDEPTPTIKLHELGDSSVNFVVRPWVRTEDYWDVYWDITRAVKERFDAEGISIPFPQRDVHLHGTDAPLEPADDASPTEGENPQETVSTSGVSTDENSSSLKRS